MADHELTPEEALRGLAELFSDDPSAPPTRGCRKYFLEYQDGEPVFRLAEMPSKPRDEIEVAFDEWRSACTERQGVKFCPAGSPWPMHYRSVSGLTRYHTPHSTSRVLHIALTTRDQMNMGMTDGLPGSISTIHTNVKTAHRRVLLRDFHAKVVQ